MTKWEKWIKEYGKRNRRNVLMSFLDSARGLPQFDQARERAHKALRDGKRFYLKNDEKLELLMVWRNQSMSLNRALALAWCCGCSVECFSYQVPGKEVIMTLDGYYATKGCYYVFKGANWERAEGVLSDLTLQEYLETNIGYKEEELWRLR